MFGFFKRSKTSRSYIEERIAEEEAKIAAYGKVIAKSPPSSTSATLARQWRHDAELRCHALNGAQARKAADEAARARLTKPVGPLAKPAKPQPLGAHPPHRYNWR